MSKPRSMVLAESLYEIKQRYEDTALVLFRERQNKPRPLSYLSIGESRKCYAYSCHENSAVVVYKKGNILTKSDEKSVEKIRSFLFITDTRVSVIILVVKKIMFDIGNDQCVWKQLTTRGNTPSGRVGHGCVFMSSSESMFIVGGANPECTFSDVYCLDLDGLTWTVVETVGFHGRYEHATVKTVHPIPGILVFGGADTKGNKNSIQVLDLKTKIWETIQVKGYVPSPRTHHCVAATDKTMFIFSGGNLGSQPVVDEDVYVFDLPSYSWNKLSVSGTCPPPRLGHILVAVADQLYLHGGMAGSSFYDDLHVLDLSTCRWKRLDPKGCVPTGRAAHGAVVVEKDFYIFGGLTSGGGVVEDLYRYDTSLETWFKINCGDQVPRGRLDFGICLVELPSGKDEKKKKQCILIHGGMDTNGKIFDDTWVFPL